MCLEFNFAFTFGLGMYKKGRTWWWFRIQWKSWKTSHAKKLSRKKWQKYGVFDYTYCVLKFSTYIFFGGFLCTFSKGFESAWKFAFYNAYVKFFKNKHFFANFKSKIRRNGSKNENVFYKCALEESHSTSVSEAPFCQKKSKSLYPTTHVWPITRRVAHTTLTKASNSFWFEGAAVKSWEAVMWPLWQTSPVFCNLFHIPPWQLFISWRKKLFLFYPLYFFIAIHWSPPAEPNYKCQVPLTIMLRVLLLFSSCTKNTKILHQNTITQVSVYSPDHQ